MRIAVIGAGFAGLSVAWHLLQSPTPVEVVVFDSKGVGAGASGIAAGLLHPYVGEQGRRSLFATEALESACELIALAQHQHEAPLSTPGVVRLLPLPEQQELFLSHAATYCDIEPRGGERFLIRSGHTVDCAAYVAALWGLIEARGGRLVIQAIESLEELQGFDQIVVATGGGTPQLVELPLSLVKGQVLLCEAPAHVELPECSLVSKGYVAFLRGSRRCYVGSTYERRFVNVLPEVGVAGPELLAKGAQFFPAASELKLLECKAAVRVIRKGHYFPILKKQQSRVWIFTALGSRGLLYHALLGKVLASAVIQNEEELLKPYHL